MKAATGLARWPAGILSVVGVATMLVASTDVARSAERDRAATASDRAVRITGSGPAAAVRKDARKKAIQQQKKKTILDPTQ